MEMVICCFFDEKVSAFMTPFFAPTVPHALRTFQDMTAEADTVIGKHPGDFSLFQLGTFDPQTGSMVVGDSRNLGNGAQFVARALEAVV